MGLCKAVEAADQILTLPSRETCSLFHSRRTTPPSCRQLQKPEFADLGLKNVLRVAMQNCPGRKQPAASTADRLGYTGRKIWQPPQTANVVRTPDFAQIGAPQFEPRMQNRTKQMRRRLTQRSLCAS